MPPNPTPPTFCGSCDDRGWRHSDRINSGDYDPVTCRDCPTCGYCGVPFAQHEGSNGEAPLNPREILVRDSGESWATPCLNEYLEALHEQAELARASENDEQAELDRVLEDDE